MVKYRRNNLDAGCYVIIDKSYGNDDGICQDSEIHEFYRREGSVTPTATDDSDAKIIYYSGFHGAKKRTCSCGSPKWYIFESKCGQSYILEHRANQVSGGAYGTPKFYYK
jgi:hypothetical protein